MDVGKAITAAMKAQEARDYRSPVRFTPGQLKALAKAQRTCPTCGRR